MRILLLVDSCFPSKRSSAKHMRDLAIELAGRGHEVALAAPDPTSAEKIKIVREDGFTALRVSSGRLKGAGRVFRTINEWRLSSQIWNAGKGYFRAHPCDLIVAYSPTIFFGALIRRLKRMWGCPVFLVLRDIFPQWTVDAGVLREGSPILGFFRRKERLLYSVCDVIAVQSPANLRYFEERGWDKRYKLDVLYNWAPGDDSVVRAPRLRTELGLEGKVVLFFGGNLGVQQDMQNLVRLAENLRGEPDVRIVLMGEGSEVPWIERRLAAGDLDNLILRPGVDQQTYLELLREFDVGLITLDRRLKHQNFPGKLFGYMAVSMPVLASVNPGNDLRQILEEHEAGLVCENGEDETLRDHALRLVRDARLRARLGANGRKLLDSKFSVSGAADRILAHFPTTAAQVSKR
jgi:glycosyltransferase involved in cell wall biosynthesis